MIVRFTNVRGETNHGIIIGTDPGGMVHVAWDSFKDLLRRLEREGKVNEFVRANLSKRRSWIRVKDAIQTGAKTELLPLGTPVLWSDVELRTLQAKMIKEASNEQ